MVRISSSEANLARSDVESHTLELLRWLKCVDGESEVMKPGDVLLVPSKGMLEPQCL